MRIVVGIFITLVLVSCHKVKKPPKPDNLIPEKEMVNILVDISLLRSAEGANKTKIERKGYNIESYVYERHNIDSVQFTLSNEYYSYDLDTYQSIYQEVEDSLISLKEFYQNKRDSIMEGRKSKKKDSVVVPRQRMFKDSLREKRESLTRNPKVIPQID